MNVDEFKVKYNKDIKALAKERDALVRLLMGEVMKTSKGRANPQKAKEILHKLLTEDE